MTLPASPGAISLSQVNTELGYSSTATISLNDTALRSLFGKAGSGTTISMSDGWGKASAFSGTITTHQQEMNLASWASSNGWSGSSVATITINSGVYIWSDNVNNPAMTTGSFPGGLTIINNGIIMGRGGNGAGFVTSALTPVAVQNGGSAISLGTNCTINTVTGYIGGGGGGGGYGLYYNSTGGSGGGGGHGGGVGGPAYFSGKGTAPVYNAPGGAGGTLGGSGSNAPWNTTGLSTNNQTQAGGGGGRNVAGAGAPNAGQQGGVGIFFGGIGGGGGGSGGASYRLSGVGGAAGVAGGQGYMTSPAFGVAGGGGGGLGAAGGNGTNQYSQGALLTYPGGTGGKAVQTNGYTVTWSGSTAHVYGAVG